MKFYTNILGLIFILTMITSCSSTPSRSVSNNNSPISQYDYSRPIVYNGYWFKLGGPNCRTFTEIYKGRMLCKNDKGIPVSYADPLTDQQVKAFSAKWFEKHRKQARSNNQIGLFEGVDYLIDSFLDASKVDLIAIQITVLMIHIKRHHLIMAYLLGVPQHHHGIPYLLQDIKVLMVLNINTI